MTDKVQKIISNLKDVIDDLGVTSPHRLPIIEAIECLQEEPVSEDTMTIRKEWFEHCKESWYNEGYIDGKYNRDRQFKEPVSEELEEACEQLAENARKHKAETSSPFFSQTDYIQGVMDGAKWQKAHNWKTADGDDLPEIDHIDTNRQNNNVNNLRWCTRKENCNNPISLKHSSECRKGEKNYLYGKSLSEEIKAKMSAALIGHPVSEETRRKIGSANRGHVMSEEQKQLLSKSHKGKRMGKDNQNAKEVRQYDKYGNFIKLWEC